MTKGSVLAGALARAAAMCRGPHMLNPPRCGRFAMWALGWAPDLSCLSRSLKARTRAYESPAAETIHFLAASITAPSTTNLPLLWCQPHLRIHEDRAIWSDRFWPYRGFPLWISSQPKRQPAPEAIEPLGRWAGRETGK